MFTFAHWEKQDADIIFIAVTVVVGSFLIE